MIAKMKTFQEVAEWFSRLPEDVIFMIAEKNEYTCKRILYSSGDVQAIDQVWKDDRLERTYILYKSGLIEDVGTHHEAGIEFCLLVKRMNLAMEEEARKEVA